MRTDPSSRVAETHASAGVVSMSGYLTKANRWRMASQHSTRCGGTSKSPGHHNGLRVWPRSTRRRLRDRSRRRHSRMTSPVARVDSPDCHARRFQVLKDDIRPFRGPLVPQMARAVSRSPPGPLNGRPWHAGALLGRALCALCGAARRATRRERRRCPSPPPGGPRGRVAAPSDA